MRNENMHKVSVLKTVIDNRSIKQKIVMGLAIIVVFIATYMMILPAISMDDKEAKDQGGIEMQKESSEAVYDHASSPSKPSIYKRD